MGIEFSNNREIELFVDDQKNIVIFPKSKSDGSVKEMVKDGYYVAYYPIELKYPYTANELAEKIKCGFDEWDKHECYGNFSGKNTFEEKYYGIKGFKNAIKGKKRIDIWQNDKYMGNILYFNLPLKRGYGYEAIKPVKFPIDVEYIDYANTVIDLINLDMETIRYFRSIKSKLNI